MIKNLFGASWRTAVSGIVISLGLCFTQIGYSLDDDPETKTDWNDIAVAAGRLVEGLGILSLAMNARDNKVSTEQARKDP